MKEWKSKKGEQKPKRELQKERGKWVYPKDVIVYRMGKIIFFRK